MPKYEYACKSCGVHMEVVQSFTDDSLTECQTCGGSLRKVFGTVGIVLKGPGFYRNDHRSPPRSEGSKLAVHDKEKSGDNQSGDNQSAEKKSGEKQSGDKSSGESGDRQSGRKESATPSSTTDSGSPGSGSSDSRSSGSGSSGSGSSSDAGGGSKDTAKTA